MTRVMNESPAATENAPALAGQYLTFMLDDEVYGLEILKVQEIIGMLPITRMPKSPEYIRGVINLRGKIIPVLSLRKRFGLPDAEDTERTCIIVVQLRGAMADVTAGIVVDEVCEVIEVAADQTGVTPAFGDQVESGFLLGMARVEGKVILLIDVTKVVEEHNVAGVQEDQDAVEE